MSFLNHSLEPSLEQKLVKAFPNEVLYISLNHLSDEIEKSFRRYQRRSSLKNYNFLKRKMDLLKFVLEEFRERNLNFKTPLIIREIYNEGQ